MRKPESSDLRISATQRVYYNIFILKNQRTISIKTFSAVTHGFVKNCNVRYNYMRRCSIQHNALFLAVFLSRIFPDARDKIEIYDFLFARFFLDKHAGIVNFFYHALYACVI